MQKISTSVFSRPSTTRGAGLLMALALSMGLAACDQKPNEPTAGQKLDTAVAKTEVARKLAARMAEALG